DAAESEPGLAFKVNCDAPAVMAEEAKSSNALFINYSTDYVFDGCKEEPYSELDVPRPLNTYGASKLAGDQAVEAIGNGYLTLRTSWVYGPRGKNFFRTISSLVTERAQVRVVNDQIGAPTSAESIAHGTMRILQQLSSGISPKTPTLVD